MQPSISQPATLQEAPSAQVTLALIGDDLTRWRLIRSLGPGYRATIQLTPPITRSAIAQLAGELTEIPQVTIVAGGEELYARGGAPAQLQELLVGSAIIIVSTVEDRCTVRRALRCGASAVIPESAVDELLELAVEAVLAGQLCLPRSLTRRVDTRMLSVRERQVLELIARGLTNGEIAQRLYLSESTVKSHLSSSFRKLGVSSRAEAAAIVLETEDLSGSPASQVDRELLRLTA